MDWIPDRWLVIGLGYRPSADFADFLALDGPLAQVVLLLPDLGDTQALWSTAGSPGFFGASLWTKRPATLCQFTAAFLWRGRSLK